MASFRFHIGKKYESFKELESDMELFQKEKHDQSLKIHNF